MQSKLAPKEELRKSLIDFYNGLIVSYPHLHRVGGDEMASITCRAWKVDFIDRCGHGALGWFTQRYLGKLFFESAQPRPHHALLLWGLREDTWFPMAERLDVMLYTHYMSLYLRDPGSRIERSVETAKIFRDLEVTGDDFSYLVAKVSSSAEWRTYPPSPYDIRSIIIRKRAGVGGCDEEFANYLQGKRTLCVKAVCNAIGVDNLRVMGTETLSRVFKRMYYTLDEADWGAIRRASKEDGVGTKGVVEEVSRENTLALFEAKKD